MLAVDKLVLIPLRISSKIPLNLYIKPDKDKVVSSTLAFRGIWESHNTLLLQKLIREGDHFLDIGSNLGYFTILAASIVGKKGKVIAFEPEPDNANITQENIFLNKMEDYTSCKTIAIGDQNAVAPLFLAKDNHGAHQLDFALRNNADGPSSSVIVKSLDSMMHDGTVPTTINGIKMDIQGYELKALLGMERLIEINKNWLFILLEFSPSLLKNFDKENKGLAAFLEYLELKVPYIYLIKDKYHLDGQLKISRLDTSNLQQISDYLLVKSEQQDHDDLVDLLLFFSEEANRLFLEKLSIH